MLKCLALFFVVSLCFLFTVVSQAKDFPASKSLKVGNKAPDISGLTWTGQSFMLKKYKGKSVVICFFTVGCAACRVLMPRLDKIITKRFQKNKDFQLVMIARCNLSRVKKFFAGKKITSPVILDSRRKLNKIYDVKYQPSIFFVGRDGLIKSCFAGCYANKLKEMALLIDADLKKK